MTAGNDAIHASLIRRYVHLPLGLGAVLANKRPANQDFEYGNNMGTAGLVNSLGFLERFDTQILIFDKSPKDTIDLLN